MTTVAEQVRAELVEQLETLFARAGRIEAHQHNLNREVPADWPEAATFRSNDAVVDALDDHTREEIAQVRAAISRIDAGTWTTCESCDDPIPEGRLRALPTATLCVRCAAEAEEERRRG